MADDGPALLATDFFKVEVERIIEQHARHLRRHDSVLRNVSPV